MRAVALLLVAACGSSAAPAGGPDGGGPAWLVAPAILVKGVGIENSSCRDGVCPHNENTDLIAWKGAIYLVHRTAMSQILGPNSSLRVYRSTNGGATFDVLAILPAPIDRDLRDPCFYVAGDRLAIKALTRLPGISKLRDTDVDTITVGTFSADGVAWTPFAPLAPETWSFWRVREHAGTLYAAAYEDGDRSIKLFSSADGASWSAGAVVYDVAADTPLEPEIMFMPSGRMLVFFRLDGTDIEILGNIGRLRTQVCWAEPPYASFTCPQQLDGVRLDGPVAFFHGARLLVFARKHLIEPEDRKRTALYELGGTLEGGPLTVTELGELPSAGDTAYAGFVEIGGDRAMVSWYSSLISADAPWGRAILEAADIWTAKLDLTRL